MLLIKANNVIVVLILFSFLRALLQATLLNTIQSELFRLKIEKKKETGPNAQDLFMTILTIILSMVWMLRI